METGVKWSGFFVLQVYKGIGGELRGGCLQHAAAKGGLCISLRITLIWNM